MTTYARPTNDSDRLSLLQLATATAATDQAAGKSYLAAETQAALSELLAGFAGVNEAVTATQAAFGQTGRATDAAFLTLTGLVQRIWSDARNRVRFGDAGPALLTYAQLPQRGRGPKPTSRPAWLEIAERLRQGASQAEEAGFAPLAQANALSALIDAAQTNLQSLLAAKTALAEARRRRNDLRQAIDRFSARLTEDLRYALRDLPPAQQRQIMRTYGVRFQQTSAGEGQIERTLPATSAAQEGAVLGWQLQPEAVVAG